MTCGPSWPTCSGPGPHPAGRRFHYSNPGFALLGALVGRLRGQDWTEALRREILDLGMARTTTSPEPPHARGFAVHPWADAMQLEPAEPTGLMAPAGELWSTADDLCRFAAFLLDGYYQGETLRVMCGPDDRADHLDLGTFVFTRRAPYGPDAPSAARPDLDGWRAG